MHIHTLMIMGLNRSTGCHDVICWSISYVHGVGGCVYYLMSHEFRAESAVMMIGIVFGWSWGDNRVRGGVRGCVRG